MHPSIQDQQPFKGQQAWQVPTAGACEHQGHVCHTSAAPKTKPYLLQGSQKEEQVCGLLLFPGYGPLGRHDVTQDLHWEHFVEDVVCNLHQHMLSLAAWCELLQDVSYSSVLDNCCARWSLTSAQSQHLLLCGGSGRAEQCSEHWIGVSWPCADHQSIHSFTELYS